MFRRLLTYKQAWRSGDVIAVNPRYTAQRCAMCGYVSAKEEFGVLYALSSTSLKIVWNRGSANPGGVCEAAERRGPLFVFQHG